MGIKRSPITRSSRTAASGGLADALFTRTQQRVLGLLFGQPSRSFYANELIALAGGGTGAVQRELGRLVSSRLATVRAVGNQKHFQANAESPLFHELCAIAQKTFGLAEPLRGALTPLTSSIRAAFVFGSVAKRQDTANSDVDLMILSDTLGYGEVLEVLEPVATRLGRSLNPTVLTGKDLARRLKRDNAFVKRVLSQPKIWLIGGEDDLPV